MHKHHIGHRDLSLENILLHKGNVRVMDFGMAVRSTTLAGTELRYFRSVGKDYYRACECYVPPAHEVEVTMPANSAPGNLVVMAVNGKHICEVRMPMDGKPGSKCKAEVWGYAACPADIWSVGVCIFAMMVGRPAWEKAHLGDKLFVLATRQGLAKFVQQLRKPELPCAAQQLLDRMLSCLPAKRPTASDCLGCDWFEDLHNAPVPTHSSEVAQNA